MVVAGRGERAATARTTGAVAAALVALAVAARLLGGAPLPWLQTFLIMFGSLLVQALPFVLVGALASAAIEVFLRPGALERLARLPRPLQLPAAGLAGVLMPICECGSVPVARRLIRRGLAPSAGVTFMLAAPVLNPVVIASTFVAFRDKGVMPVMVGGRVLLGLLVAVAVGWAIGDDAALLRTPRGGGDAVEDHDHGADEPRWRRLFLHLGGDFLFMGRYLVLGVTLAALVQAFLPTTALEAIADQPVLAVASMMVLASLLSLCSESDAFVAASFVQFGVGPQLAFLVFGPMVDLKLGVLYAGTFRRGFVSRTVAAAAAATFVGALWIGVIAG